MMTKVGRDQVLRIVAVKGVLVNIKVISGSGINAVIVRWHF